MRQRAVFDEEHPRAKADSGTESRDVWTVVPVRGVLCWASITAGVIKFHDEGSPLGPCEVAGVVLGRRGRCCDRANNVLSSCDSTFGIKEALCGHGGLEADGLDVQTILDTAGREPVIAKIKRSGGLHVVGVMEASLINSNVLKVRIGDPDGTNPIGSLRIDLRKIDTAERRWKKTLTSKSAPEGWWQRECSVSMGGRISEVDDDSGLKGIETLREWSIAEIEGVLLENLDLVQESAGIDFRPSFALPIEIWGLDVADAANAGSETLRDSVQSLGWLSVISDGDGRRESLGGAGVTLTVDGESLVYAGYYGPELVEAIRDASDRVAGEGNLRLLRIPGAFLFLLWVEGVSGHQFVVLPPTSFRTFKVSDREEPGIIPFAVWDISELRTKMGRVLEILAGQPEI